MANIGTLTAHIGIDNMGLQRGLTQAQGRFSQFSAGAMKSIAKISGAFAALGLAVGGLAVFRSMTKTGIDFEQTMTTVAGVMRATADESKRLTAAARKMGETTEWSASQAGDALQFLGMAGFEANKAIKALPGTLDLATAGQIELGRAADIATNALTAMGLEVEELERVNDVFVGTITRSNTNMEMMAESFKYAAPVARAYGYTIEELSGLIGMLGNAGIQGSMAGTQLAMAIQKTNDVAKDFGLPGGNFVDVLEQLREKGYSSAEVIKAFGLRAGRAAGVLYEATDATREFQGTLANVSGEAGRLADKMRSTVGASFKELKSVIESLALDVFETYRDELKGLVVDTTAWIREHKDEIVAFVGGIKTAFVGIIETITGVARALSNLGMGFTDFFKAVKDGAASTADSVAESGERIRGALSPPELTPWQKFWEALKSGWMAVGEVMFFVLRAVESLIVGVLNTGIEILGMLKEIHDRAWALDFKGMWKELTEPDLKSPRVLFKAWTDEWNDMMRELALPDWMKKIGARPGAATGFVGPRETFGPWPTVEGAPAPPPPPPSPVITIEPPVITGKFEWLSDYIDRLKDMVAEYKTIQQNRYDWLYEHEKISSDEYLAFLEHRLSGETEYSNAWMAIQNQIESVKDGVVEADKARWAEQIAAQEEALDMLLVGYDTFWQSLLELDMTGAERRKAIFESIARAFMDYTAQMTKDWIKNALLQKTVTEGAEKSKLAAVAAGAMGRIAWAAKEGAAAIASAAKSIYSAVAKIFEAHAWIPFAGVAIAAGFVGAMMATLGAFKKFHQGGLVGDEVIGIMKKREYVLDEPTVQAVGVPALDYLTRTHRFPESGGGGPSIVVGDVTIGQTGTPKDYFLLDDFKDVLVEVIEEKLKNRELVL